jgi:hypothetical protein
MYTLMTRRIAAALRQFGLAAAIGAGLSTSAGAVVVGDPGVSQFAIGGLSLLSTLSDPSVRGWRFHANDSFEISALGLADYDAVGGPGGLADGFNTAHSVILWDLDGNQLASATIQAGTGSEVGPGAVTTSATVFINGSFFTVTGEFRYEMLTTPVAITAGSDYVISAFFPGGANRDLTGQKNPSTALVTDPRITAQGSRFLVDVATHDFPTGVFFGSAVDLGPTFLIAVDDDNTDTGGDDIPVPGTLPLLLAGFLGAGLFRRRSS